MCAIAEISFLPAVSQFANWKEFESAYYYSRRPNYNAAYDSYSGQLHAHASLCACVKDADRVLHSQAAFTFLVRRMAVWVTTTIGPMGLMAP